MRRATALLLGAAGQLAALATLLRPWRLLGRDWLLGQPTRDLFDHYWLHRWLARSLLHGGSLLHTRELAWPEGGRLLHPDPTGALLYLLGAPLLPPAQAFDLSILLQLWLSGLAAWALASRLSGSLLAGWVGGLAFALSPYLVGQALGGETETVAAWPLALALLALEELRGWRSALLAGALAALTAAASWYHGAFLGLYGLAFLLLRRPPLRWSLLAAGTALGLIAPLAVTYARLLGPGTNLFQGPALLDYLRHYPGALAGMVADPAAWLLPAQPGSPRPEYLGAALLALGLLGLLAGGRGARWWGGVAAAALLLALGPELHWQGRPTGLPLPGRLLASLPVLGLMRLPHRWTVLASLALAVLGARGLARTLEAGRARSLGAALAALALLHDLAAHSGLPLLARVDATPPPVESRLPGRGAVLDLPPRLLGDDARGLYLAWQPAHGRPVPYALLMSGLSPSLAAEPLVQAVSGLDSRDPLPERPLDAAQLHLEDYARAAADFRRGRRETSGIGDRRAALLALGVDAVVLHEELLEPDDARRIEALLRRSLGPPAGCPSPDPCWALERPVRPSP